MLLKELMNLVENVEDDFESVFKDVVNKLGFKNIKLSFDSSSTDSGVKAFFKAEKMLMSLLHEDDEDDEDVIGIIGKNGDKVYYSDIKGKGKYLSIEKAQALINKLDPDGVGILKIK